METEKEFEFLSFGAGVDSSAILAMHLNIKKSAKLLGMTVADLRKHIPDYDAIVFSDPGSEWPETYEHIEFVKEQCQAAGVHFEIVRYKQGFYRHYGTNERIRVTDFRALPEHEKDNWYHVVEPLTISEWLITAGSLPMLPGASHVCSDKFKGGVQRKWSDSEYPGASKTWTLGIEANESKRHKRFTMNKKARAEKGQKEPNGHDFRYPLIELNLTRDNCITILEYLGWPVPPKSSCMFCPWVSDWEIDKLVEADGIGLQQALAIEKSFYKHDKHADWHRDGEPLNKGGRCNKGHHRQPYVTGFCDQPQCASHNKHGKATLIQLKYPDKDGVRRRLTIAEHIERVRNQ
jgi:hypothetical protein